MYFSYFIHCFINIRINYIEYINLYNIYRHCVQRLFSNDEFEPRIVIRKIKRKYKHLVLFVQNHRSASHTVILNRACRLYIYIYNINVEYVYIFTKSNFLIKGQNVRTLLFFLDTLQCVESICACATINPFYIAIETRSHY